MELIVILLIAGAALLYLETFLPGMIAGILGVLCLLAAVITGYSELGLKGGNIVLAVTLALCAVGSWCYFKYFPDSKAARRFTSTHVLNNSDAARPHLLHQNGNALTPLRPGGTALIAGERVDVVTEGAPVERGQAVKVIAIEGMKVVVRAVT